MADNNSADKKCDSTDKELSDLLDSALADFSKDSTKEEPNKDANDEEQVEEITALDQEWNQDFIKQISEQFQTGMAALLGEANSTAAENITPDQIQASLQKMAEAAQQVFQVPVPPVETSMSNDISSTISQTIQGLSEGTETLQNPFNDTDILSMFSNLQGEGEQNSFLPFMEGMMQSLLSKDVLYPSLSDIIAKFPGWLEENNATLSVENKERYTKQLELMQQVCGELESEREDDPADLKSVRFNKVLGLMQTLQNYGQPPVDIVGEVGSPGLPFDNPEQCCIM